MQVHKNWARRLLLVCAPVSIVSCQTQSPAPHSSAADEPVASIGDHQITAYEFRIAYELASPSKFPVTNDPFERKHYFLDRMVERKVLALVGSAEGLDTTRAARRVVEWERRQALIRALYRSNIEAYIDVTEEDLREAFIKSSQVVVLRQILLSSRADANTIYQRILAGESFESIAIERAPPGTPPARVLEPREFAWGELDSRLEAAAFGLNYMEASAPIETPSGIHILQLADRRHNVMLTESAFDSRRSYLDVMLRRQRGASASEDYLKSLASETPATVRSRTVTQMAEAASVILRDQSAEVPLPTTLQVRHLEGRFGSLGSEVIVNLGGHGWTVDEFVKRVVAMPPNNRPDLTVPASIARAIATLVRDDLLVGEALRQGLQNDEAVVEDVERVNEEVTSQLKRAELFGEIEVTDADIRSFYADSAARYLVPERVRVREVMVRDESLADSILEQARLGEDLADLARRHSVRTWAAERDGDLGPITEKAFGSVGEAAFNAPVGELVGPVPVLVDSIPVGYSVLRVIERIPAEIPKLESIENRVAKDARTTAQNETIARFMAGAADRWPVATDDEVLASIRTTDETTEGRPMDMVLVRRAR